MTELRSPLQAHIVQRLVQPGDAVQPGQLLLVLEAMKMNTKSARRALARCANYFAQ